MKLSTFVVAAFVSVCAAVPQAVAQQATADKPVMCWDYNTLGDGVGSRFGIKGTVDDVILSRAGYYTLTKLKAKVTPPMAAGTTTWFKLELRAEAVGDDPVMLSGLLIDLENPIVGPVVAGASYEMHVLENGSVKSLSVIPLEARFKAGDAIVRVPFKSQGPKLNRQDVEVRLGAYSPPTRVSGQPSQFDPKATFPLIKEIDAAWRKAGTLTIELALAADGTVVATSDGLPYIGDEADAEFVRMDLRSDEMISGGKCQFLTD